MSGHGNPTPSLRVSMKLYLPMSILYTEKKSVFRFGLFIPGLCATSCCMFGMNTPIITAINMAKMKSCMHRQHKQLDYIINIFPVMAGCVNNLFVFSCYPTIALASILQSVLRPG